MKVVALHEVTKRFGGRTVVDRVDLEAERGSVLALLGPSGCGKSTTLRMIAGLETVDGGRIELDGEVVSTPDRLVPPEQRRVGMVFQSFALFPHLTVADNVAFGARDRTRVSELLALVGLADRSTARVQTLSGGEQQRVALVRALAMEPRLILLDEPFANLDAALRRQLRDEVARTLRSREVTAILVTHDASEAFALSDRVAVMMDGRVLQHGTPEDVYLRPASLEVARRTGEVIELAGKSRGNGTAATCLGELTLASPAPAGEVTVVLRPEQIALSADGRSARVVRRVFEGGSTYLELAVDDHEIALRAPGAVSASVGDEIRIAVPDAAIAFAASGATR